MLNHYFKFRIPTLKMTSNIFSRHTFHRLKPWILTNITNKFSHSFIYFSIIFLLHTNMHVCMYIRAYLGSISSLRHLIKYRRHLLSTHFYFNPFKLPYGCYNIQLKLAPKFSIINWFPSTFGPLLGHHQGVYILQKYNTSFLFFLNLFLLP